MCPPPPIIAMLRRRSFLFWIHPFVQSAIGLPNAPESNFRHLQIVFCKYSSNIIGACQRKYSTFQICTNFKRLGRMITITITMINDHHHHLFVMTMPEASPWQTTEWRRCRGSLVIILFCFCYCYCYCRGTSTSVIILSLVLLFFVCYWRGPQHSTLVLILMFIHPRLWKSIAKLNQFQKEVSEFMPSLLCSHRMLTPVRDLSQFAIFTGSLCEGGPRVSRKQFLSLVMWMHIGILQIAYRHAAKFCKL